MHSLANVLLKQTCPSVHPERPDREDVPVVGVSDHAVAVEHAADVLLRPVTARQLFLHQVTCRAVQGCWVLGLVVARGQQCEKCPGRVDNMRVPLKLMVDLDVLNIWPQGRVQLA